jgi:hypothetical protein
VGALLAHRPQQQAGEAAVAARADHQEIGAARFLHQNCARRALDHDALDLDTLALRNDLARHTFDQFLCRPMDRIDIDGQRGVRTERANGMDGAQPRLAEPRLLECKRSAVFAAAEWSMPTTIRSMVTSIRS